MAQDEGVYGNETIVLDEISVTAGKREQDLSRFDGAVSVRSGEELREAGVTTVAELEKVFPGLVIRTRGNRAYANITVRGMSSPDFYNPAVQIYVDGVPQQASAFTQPLVDVERVEFLRGPQGTLYGANAYGGVINVISRRPDRNRLNATAIASNNYYEGEAAGTVVLSQHGLYLDGAIRGDRDTGSLNDASTGASDFDTGTDVLGRATLRYAPQGGLFDGALSFSREQTSTREEVYLLDSEIKNRNYFSALQGPYPLLERDITTASATGNWQLSDSFKLTSITSYQYVDMTRDIPVGPSFSMSFPETDEALTEELRLVFSDGGPVTGLIGLFLQREDFSRTADAYPGFYGPAVNEIATDSYAAFGELTWSITEQFDLTGGMRVSYDRSSIDYDRPDIYGNGYGFAFENEDSFVGYQPKVALGYEVVPGTRLYGLVSRGYKPGGFNHTIASPNDAEPYDPETAWNYEAGVRSSLFDGRLELSVALYHIDSTDKQIYVGPIGFQVLQNMGDATSTGVELEARWQVTDRLRITANAAFGRSEFTNYVDPITFVDYSGNTLPYAPDQTANLLARYTFERPVFDGRLSIEGGMNYIGSFYFNEANTLEQPGYLTFDAAMELAWDSGVTLKLFVDNIADETYRTYSYESAGNVFSNVGESRTIGLAVRGSF